MYDITSVGRPRPRHANFLERMARLRDVNQMYARGEILWDALWYYEQRYAVGAKEEHAEENCGSSTVVEPRP